MVFVVESLSTNILPTNEATLTTFTQRRLDMRHHSCDIPKVFSHVTIDTEQL